MIYAIAVDGKILCELVQSDVPEINEISVMSEHCFLCLRTDETYGVFEESKDGTVMPAGFRLCKECAGI